MYIDLDSDSAFLRSNFSRHRNVTPFSTALHLNDSANVFGKLSKINLAAKYS